MTINEYKKYKKILKEIFDYFGGALGLAVYLKVHYSNVYEWRSDTNYKDNKLKRKIPITHVKKIIKKLPHISVEQLRPDIFEN